MKDNILRGLLLGALLAGGAALAQVHVDVALPSIHFAVAPPLVVVDSGVQVVPDQEEEVFYSGGWYWTRRDARWYRCRRDWRWQPVEYRRVPPGLARIPPGHYRHWHGNKHGWKHRDRDDDRHDWDDRDHGDYGHGHGHGHGRH